MIRYYNVAPRYTSGSPAMVPEYIATRVAIQEREAYEHALSGRTGPEDVERAKTLGLACIVEERWEQRGKLQFRDLITGEYGERPFPSSLRSIYQTMIDNGVKVDNHESDLYVPVNDLTRAIVRAYECRSNVRTFRNQIDRELWYDIPFAFQPWWDARKC